MVAIGLVALGELVLEQQNEKATRVLLRDKFDAIETKYQEQLALEKDNDNDNDSSSEMSHGCDQESTDQMTPQPGMVRASDSRSLPSSNGLFSASARPDASEQELKLATLLWFKG